MGDGPNPIESGFGHQRSNGAGSRAGPATTMLRAESAANRRRLKDAEKAMLRQPRGRHRGDDADGNSHQDAGAPNRPPQAAGGAIRRAAGITTATPGARLAGSTEIGRSGIIRASLGVSRTLSGRGAAW